MKPLVIYHADCTDGFAAAFAAWLKFGDEAEYLPMQYNSAEYNPQDRCFVVGKACYYVQDREVYVLDFSFGRDLMDELLTIAKRVVWLDHHKTAFEMWCGKYEKGMEWHDSVGNGSVHRIILNDNKSGAMLAWQWFHPGTEVPMLIRHIDDRDRWQFKLEGSKELHAFLASVKPWSFAQWRELNAQITSWDDSVSPHFSFREGAAILRAQTRHVADMVKQARECKLSYWIPKPEADDAYAAEHVEASGLAVNAPLHTSEVGHELANASGTYGLVWYLGSDNKVKLSFRSNGGYDVSAIAKALGGGGHRNAAGAETDINTLMSWLK